MNIERIVRSVTKRVYTQYPHVEWEDLEAQAWLIVTERIGQYQKDQGTTLSTYLYGTLYNHLRVYVHRVILKGQDMRGLRVHTDEEGITEDIRDRMEAKLTVESILARSTGTQRIVLQCMIAGDTQTECAKKLGMSRQYISKVLIGVREEYK